MKRKKNFYSDELKLKFVQEYLSTDVSQEELKKKYGVSGNSCMSAWMRKFGLSMPSQSQINVHTTMSKEMLKTDKEKFLEVRIKQLEKDLEYEKLRTQALDTMITIAERELNIPIRKKSGTKQ